MNKYLILLVISFSFQSFALSELEKAELIYKATKTERREINGLRTGFREGLENNPKADQYIECMIDKYIPYSKKQALEIISTSLDKEPLTQGSILASSKYLELADPVLLENNRDYAAQAKAMDVDLTSYLYLLASQKQSDPQAKKDMLAFSSWLKMYAPIYSKERAKKVPENMVVMRKMFLNCQKQ